LNRTAGKGSEKAQQQAKHGEWERPQVADRPHLSETSGQRSRSLARTVALSARLPSPWIALAVVDSKHSNLIRICAAENTIRKTPNYHPPHSQEDFRARRWKAADVVEGRFHAQHERLA
jgi:hypothetical protein